MLYQLKKSISALNHPGVRANYFQLIRNAIPYYISPNLNVPPPITIFWVINSVCNLRCKMCDVGTFNEKGTFFKNLRIDRKLHQIELETFKKVVDETVKARPLMAFNSTEPTMYPDIAEAVAYCSFHNMPSAITTGGYALGKVAKDLAKAGLTRLNLSIDGPPEVHNQIRGRSDSFEKSIEGAKEFLEHSKALNKTSEVTINCTITNLNAHALPELYNSISDLDFSSLNLTLMWFLSPNMTAEQNELFGNQFPVSTSCFDEYINPLEIDIEKLCDDISVLSKKRNVVFSRQPNKTWLEKFHYQSNEFMEPNAGCMASWFFPQILADGRVGVHTRCHNQTFGNIYDEPLLKIWNGDKIKKWRSFIKAQKKMPMCKRCDLVY